MNIPIITYHKISNDREFGLTTQGLKAFEAQIFNLVSKGYKSITFKDLNNGKPIPQKSVIISFDDGYESVYQNAFPILQKYNLTASIFIVANYLGKYNDWESFAIQRKYRHLSKSQILELKKYGYEIASHSLNHYYLPFCSDKTIRREVEVSMKKLEDITGDSVVSFCFPYGKYNQNSLKIVEEAGYKYATGNIQLLGRNKSDYPFNLPRRSIYATDSLKSFSKKLEYSRKINLLYLTEWTIQLGAWTGILKKRYQNI